MPGCEHMSVPLSSFRSRGLCSDAERTAEGRWDWHSSLEKLRPGEDKLAQGNTSSVPRLPISQLPALTPEPEPTS